jgi:ABC-type transport system involved in multi-copper enzyme maturation permease subunit
VGAAVVAARPAPHRRGFVDGVVATVRVTGLSLLRGRRAVALALVCAAPLVFPLIGLFKPGHGPKGGVGFLWLITTFYFARVNLLVALFLGCGALGEEIEGKTLPYLLLRPVPRSALVIGRWLTAILTSAALLGGTYLVVYVATVAPMGVEALRIDLPMLGYALLGVVISLFAYGAFFMLLAVVAKWPLLIGLALLFLFEEWAASMPGQLARYTVLHHVYNLLSQWTGSETYQRLASPYGDEVLPAGESLQVLAWICAVSLGIALWRFRKRPYLV